MYLFIVFPLKCPLIHDRTAKSNHFVISFRRDCSIVHLIWTVVINSTEPETIYCKYFMIDQSDKEIGLRNICMSTGWSKLNSNRFFKKKPVSHDLRIIIQWSLTLFANAKRRWIKRFEMWKQWQSNIFNWFGCDFFSHSIFPRNSCVSNFELSTKLTND